MRSCGIMSATHVQPLGEPRCSSGAQPSAAKGQMREVLQNANCARLGREGPGRLQVQGAEH